MRLDEGQFGWDFLVVPVSNRHGLRDYLIQTDWDYLPWASLFGWVEKDNQTLSDQIASAGEYLSENIGKVVKIDFNDAVELLG